MFGRLGEDMATQIAARRYTLDEIERLRAALRVRGYAIEWENAPDFVMPDYKERALVVTFTWSDAALEDMVRTAMMAGVDAEEAEDRLRKTREDFFDKNKDGYPEAIDEWIGRRLA